MVEFKKSDIQKIAQIVREETGNNVQEKNYAMLESRMRSHLIKLGINSVEEYWKHFEKTEKSEREVLQSLMTTHYTFFFREFVHFELLLNWIESESERLKQRYSSERTPFRIWTAACSRGQEAYSLAMFLEVHLRQKHGVPFEIVATDIDPESIAIAKNGVYPIKEVNTIPHIYLQGFWKKGTGSIKDFAAIKPLLRETIRFEALNLFDVSKWSEKKSFDIVFCRNVFIYFTQEDVRKVALMISDRINPGGLFISGLSEPLRFEGWSLESIGPSCYKRSRAVESSTNPKILRTTDAPIASPKPPEVAKYRVLCVDDSPTIQALMKKIFSQDPLCSYFEVASNGREAREKLNSQTFDIVTLDIHMPEVSGIEFLERFYNRRTDPPVIMVSSVSRTDLELATKSMSLGAFDYVEKPAMNNLQKSSEELLTKVKMALRLGKTSTPVAVTDEFEVSIGQKIVVPDASQCLRIVFASRSTLRSLEQVIKGQVHEYRSPALLIIWKETDLTSIAEKEIINWSNRPLQSIRDDRQQLRPNSIFLSDQTHLLGLLSKNHFKQVSLQILHTDFSDFTLPTSLKVQVLLDEPLSAYASKVASRTRIQVSDITPATSFPSLSVEYFANLRKAMAA